MWSRQGCGWYVLPLLLPSLLPCAAITGNDLTVPLFSDTGISKPEKPRLPPSPHQGRRTGWGRDRTPRPECNAERSTRVLSPVWFHKGRSMSTTCERSQGILAYCNLPEHADYGGDPAFVWGMNFRVADAAECCEACLAHRETCADPSSKGTKFWEPSISGAGHCGGHLIQGEPVTCNVWVFCGEPQCFSFDIHNHTRGECWLKRVVNPARPEPWNGGSLAFPPEMRDAPRQEWPWAVRHEHWPWPMPGLVSWDAGAITDNGEQVTHSHPEDRPDWYHQFCKGHHCTGYPYP